MRNGTRVLLASALLAACWQARADLMLSGHSVSGGFGMSMSSQEQIWIRETLVRRDYSDRGRSYTQLFDLDRKQVVVIDHFVRSAEVHDLAALEAGANVNAPVSSLKQKFEPTGNARMLNSWTCREHELEASMPARLGNEETVFHLRGKIWVASGTPEQKEIKDLVNAAKRPDFFLGIPALVKAAPVQARLMSELIRKLASKGLPCAAEIEGSYEGYGPLVNLARKLPSKAGVAFRTFSSEAIKPEMFAIPASYRVVQARPQQLPVGPQ